MSRPSITDSIGLAARYRHAQFEAIRRKLAERILNLARAEQRSSPQKAAILGSLRLQIENQLRAVTATQRQTVASMEETEKTLAEMMASRREARAAAASSTPAPAAPTAGPTDAEGPSSPIATEEEPRAAGGGSPSEETRLPDWQEFGPSYRLPDYPSTLDTGHGDAALGARSPENAPVPDAPATGGTEKGKT